MALYNSTRDFAAAASVHIMIIILSMILFFLIPGSTMQQVMLNSSIPNGSRVCSGQSIEIKCATTESSVQRWGSNNYVGQTTGDLEEVIYNDEIGKLIHTGNLNVSIELLNRTQSENEGIRLESILRMKASSLFPNITVLCYNGVRNSSESMSFTVIDDPDNIIVRDVDVFQVAQTPVAAGPCMLVVTWSPLAFITEPSDFFLNLTVNSFSLIMNSTAGRAVYNMSECGNHSIEIYAGNSYCDGSGPTVSRVVTDITPVINIANDVHLTTIEPTVMSTFKVTTKTASSESKAISTFKVATASSMVLPMLLAVVMLSVC